ncbi:MAG: hypothetical protein RBQ97_04175 [Acholeplasma sp.]|nr:hypothetical protein [Acholeplasma sp.]
MAFQGTDLPSQQFNTRYGSGGRPGIHSAAGGIIGYGLCVMNRMINHGEISATDVAGGIVGATVALRTASHETVVRIDTAINYGDIRAIRVSEYDNVVFLRIVDASHFYDNRTGGFIYPSSPVNDIRLLPETKRGFGGIFGRLQRTVNQKMSSRNGCFDYVVNMSTTIDLVGRLDQNMDFSSSYQFFDFPDAKYYSAKINDTTQAVFTGYKYVYSFKDGFFATSGRYSATVGTVTLNNVKYYYHRYTITNATDLKLNTEIFNVYVRGSSPLERVSQISTTDVAGTELTFISERVTYVLAPISERYFSGNVKTVKPIAPTNASFDGAIYVPIITENPNLTVPNREVFYAYDENFEMRDDSTTLNNGEKITSYIYYAENDILANRFAVERPRGMYVLSSTAGSVYGSVLPKNFIIDDIWQLKKDVSNDLDYDNIPDYQKVVDNNLIDRYVQLYQTRLNEKSELLQNKQTLEIQEETSGAEFFNPEIDYDTKDVYFTVNLSLLNGNKDLSFLITNVAIPYNAMIAREKRTNEGETAFNNLLKVQIGNKIATGGIKPELSVNVTGANDGDILYAGCFVSYSEAAVNDRFLVSKYKTKYNVYIKVVDDLSNNVYLEKVRYYGSQSGTSDITGVHDVQYKLGLIYRDVNKKLPLNYAFHKYVKLYYIRGTQRTLVNEKYYSMSETTTNATDRTLLETSIGFSEKLRPGRYELEYKYYPAGTAGVLEINYDPNITPDVTYMLPYSGTYFDFDMNEADVAFLYDLVGIHGKNIRQSIDSSIPWYLDNTSYTVGFLQAFETTPFFQLRDVNIKKYFLGGNYIYYVEFITSDLQTITKFIVERDPEPTYYNNGIRVNENSLIEISREGVSEIGIDLHIGFLSDFVDKYENLKVEITKNSQTVDSIKVFVKTDDIRKVVFTEQSETGVYKLKITYDDGNKFIDLGILEVVKNKGSNAYLKNIAFSEYVYETKYANIYVANSLGNINASSPYEPKIYYAGIDYDEADKNRVELFRVDGEVSNIPLTEYAPIMLDYLPIGARIRRKIYNNGVESWTQFVDANSTATEKRFLDADFTVIQKTGVPPTEDQDVIVTYQVISEDGSSSVLYFVTVTDIYYNVTMKFDLYFRNFDDQLIPIKDSILKDQTLLIDIMNFETNVPVTNELAPSVGYFPSFSEIIKLNTRVSMFYTSQNNYNYVFGRNVSGFYNIKMDLPLNFSYEIYYNNFLMKEFSDYVPSQEGFYYYINSSVRMRNVEFKIVIFDLFQTPGWGLQDKHNHFN